MKTQLVATIAGTGQAGFSGDGGPAASAELSQPHSITFGPDGDLFICDIANHRVRKVDSAGIISTFAGTGEQAATPDGGKFAEVSLQGPRAMEFDADGQLWLVLREGNQVRTRR